VIHIAVTKADKPCSICCWCSHYPHAQQSGHCHR